METLLVMLYKQWLASDLLSVDYLSGMSANPVTMLLLRGAMTQSLA